MKLLSAAVKSPAGWNRRTFWGWLNAVFNRWGG